jgi:hypothetical protein
MESGGCHAPAGLLWSIRRIFVVAGEQVSRIGLPVGLLLIFAPLGATWLLDRWSARDLAAEGRAITARAFELSMRALAPGSALACLDGTVGEPIQDACEKVLFATPESAASAISYVSAQVSLLAAAKQHAQASALNYFSTVPTVRRAVEGDRFGIVGYLVSTRPGCRPDKCEIFDLLQDPARVRANVASRTFEGHVQAHVAEWASAGPRIAAGAPTSDPAAPGVAGATASAKPASGIFFPSSSSIPPVNIMAAEPASSPQTQEASAADAAARSRRQQQAAPPTQAPPTARQPAGTDGSQARPGPLQITPPVQ